MEKGTLNSDSAWQLVTDGPISLGVTGLTFEMAFGRSGVTAGTYRSVQVDKYGRVVAATNPSTVAGYGLTDVFTKGETYSRTEITQAIATAVSTAVSGLVDAAPGALDTLKELAAAIGNDPNYATTMVNELAKKAPLNSPKFTGAPEVPTPAAGSAGLQAANMSALAAAVSAASRQFKAAVIGVNSNLTLTAAQAGNAVQFNTGPVTLTLPAVADVGNGASFMLRNPSATATQTLNVAAAGSIVDGGSTITTVSIKPFEWMELAASGTAWFVIGRGKLKETAEIDSPSFTGVPQAPTAPLGTNTAQIATMAALMQALMAYGLGSTAVPTITDFNAPTATGFYKALGTAANTPYQSAVGTILLLNIQYSTTGCLQLAGVATQTQANMKLYWRSQSTTYCEWREVGATESPAFTGVPTAPTAAVGTNTAQLCTMAALLQGISAFKRNYSGNVVGIGADITLTGSQTGYAFNVTAPVTVTLPAAADAGSGGTYVIRNVSSGVVTVAAPASGKIFEKNNTVTTAVLQAGEWIELQASTTNYFINQRGTLGEINKMISDAMASFGIGGYSPKPGVDLNTLTVGGLYYCLNPANSPVGTAGTSSANGYVLSFQYMDGTSYGAQVFIPSLVGAALDTMHFRRMTSGNWGSWRTLGTTEFVQQALALVGLGTNQAQLCADVDAQANSGFFYLNTGSSANMPYANNGFLLHFPWNGSSAALQFYVAASVDKLMYRAKSSGSWRAWKDIPSLDGVISAISNNSRSFRPQTILGVAANMSLNTTTHMGAMFQFNANGLTVTLPSSATVTDGTVVTLRNPRAVTQTLAVAAGSVVEEGVTSDKMTLQAYEWIELTSSGTAWFVSARGKVKESATVEQLNTAVTSAAPPGMVGHFALSAPPAGWLKRNGAAYSRTTYAALFAAIGTQFGAGDGSTTFNVPDDRELFDRAWTDGLNSADSGRALFSAQGSQNAMHGHTTSMSAAGGHYHTTTLVRERIEAARVDAGGNAVLGDEMTDGPQPVDTNSVPNHTHSLTINQSGGADARPSNRAYLACIKY